MFKKATKEVRIKPQASRTFGGKRKMQRIEVVKSSKSVFIKLVTSQESPTLK